MKRVKVTDPEVEALYQHYEQDHVIKPFRCENTGCVFANNPDRLRAAIVKAEGRVS